MYEVVYCSDCKKPVKSVPSWLASVNVRFSCESCRQRHPRGGMGFDAPGLSAASRAGDNADADEHRAPGELVEDDAIDDEDDDDSGTGRDGGGGGDE